MAVGTFMTMCVLWSLWTVPSVADFFWLLGAAANVDIRGLVLLCLLALIVFFLTTLAAPIGSHQSKSWIPSAAPAMQAATALVLMLAVAQPAVRDMLPSALRVPLKSIQTASPNARDNFEISKGYYDLLDTKDDPGAEPPPTLAQDFANIQSGADTCEGKFHVKRWRLRDDGLLMIDLKPSLRLTYPPCWQQPMTFSTNTFGMRDKEYALEKPAATLRIEIFGQSTVMGNGVSDDQTFSKLLENRLNENLLCTRYQKVEVLNFGVDGYTLVQQLTLLEERGLMFSPDIVLMTEPGLGRWWMRDYLSNIAFYHLKIPYERLEQLFEQAGLNAIEHGGIPIPFQSWRNLAKRFGINSRMPTGERRSRAARLADAVTSWTWHRLADLAAAHGATGVALALDVPSDDPAVTIPNLGAIRAAKLPVIDLYDVFPPGQRKSLIVSESDDHPNAAGHQLIANRLAKELAPFIQERCAGGPSK
jgi:lysophospholipase L1-like esterase